MKNIKNKPLFTILIPTKDRADYLKYTLETCSIQDYENLEIIVSDDGSADNTKSIVEHAAAKDSRIRYVSPGSNVGMWGNFEFALNHARPGFVIFLGGDDGILPFGISEMQKLLNETGQELLCWPTPTYIYSGVRADKSQLLINAKWGILQKGYRVVDSKRFLARQARDLSYVFDVESPMIYVKGVVSTDLIERVKNRSVDRKFYSCSTPDGYSGIVLAGEVESFIFSNTPFTIHGASPSSQGVAYLGKTDAAKKQSEEFFRLASSQPMHKELASQPYSPLISLMTADYLLTAKDLPGWPGVVPQINYQSMLKKALSELAHAQWAQERVDRELIILNEIAKYHQIENWFQRELTKTKRNLWKPLEGGAVSPTKIFIDCSMSGIDTITKAAYIAYSMHKVLPYLRLRSILRALFNSISHKLLFLRLGRPLSNKRSPVLGE